MRHGSEEEEGENVDIVPLSACAVGEMAYTAYYRFSGLE